MPTHFWSSPIFIRNKWSRDLFNRKLSFSMCSNYSQIHFWSGRRDGVGPKVGFRRFNRFNQINKSRDHLFRSLDQKWVGMHMSHVTPPTLWTGPKVGHLRKAKHGTKTMVPKMVLSKITFVSGQLCFRIIFNSLFRSLKKEFMRLILVSLHQKKESLLIPSSPIMFFLEFIKMDTMQFS